MTELTSAVICPNEVLASAIEAVQRDDAEGLAQVEALLRDYDGDPRLHFLRGSLLAGQQRYDDARVAMTRAVDLAPDYAIARYQLGFLELTSGNAAAATEVWGPMALLPADNPYRVLTEGLIQLARDEFAPAIATLERGMALNTENPVVNSDIRLLIQGIREKLEGAPAAESEDATSATHLLLRQYKADPTKH